jgi:Fe-S oxidoreductase
VAERVSEEALMQCTTCNACVEACPVLIRHVDMIVDARRWIVAEGKLSGTGAMMLRQVASTDHAWGQPRNAREDWMKDMDIPLCRDGVEFEWLFWVGCAGATDPGAVKTTKAVAQLLKKAGVSFACLGQEEVCTGDPARRIGDEFLFQEKAMGNAAVFQQYKVKKVVTPCPHCFNTLKNEYGQIFPMLEDPQTTHHTSQTTSPFEVMHHSQLLAQLVADGKLKAAPGDDTVFHDPCYLARINNESDAPRAVFGEKTDYNEGLSPDPSLISSGNQTKKLVEPLHKARKTLCCGAGGGRMWMEEPPTQRPSNRRAEELVATGASTVAVACPFCRIMLGDSLKQVTQKEINLVDLAEALQSANH